MTVVVTLPRHLRITALWLGISTGSWGNGPGGRPTGMMEPILARSHQALTAGAHTFGLHWRVPSSQSRRSLYLVSAWSSHRPPASTAGGVAVLALTNIGRACRSFLSRWQAHEVVGYGRAVRAGGEVGDVALQLGQGPTFLQREAFAEPACWC